jgi:hypothetical protein
MKRRLIVVSVIIMIAGLLVTCVYLWLRLTIPEIDDINEQLFIG